MNKLKFLLLFLLPLAASAQLDKIKQGMTREEMKQIFPAMQPDISAMSSWIYTNDSLQGIKGTTEYVIRQDTVLRYAFSSKSFAGPCKEYPNVDQSGSLRLMKTAFELSGRYTTLFGKPIFAIAYPYLSKDTAVSHDTIYFARWKKGNDELKIILSHPGKNKHYEMNAPLLNKEELEPGCKYTLEVTSLGTGTTFKQTCGNGMTGQEFKNAHPNLSNQVENHPDSWIAEDTVTSHSGNWRFTFEGDALDSYSLDIYDGAGYTHKSDSAYVILSRKAIALYGEAKKLYGKTDTLINKVFTKYPGKHSNIYHHTVHFAAEWKIKDKKLYVIFDESAGGKQFDAIFHLMLYYGRPIMEE